MEGSEMENDFSMFAPPPPPPDDYDKEIEELKQSLSLIATRMFPP
jgi:hypothetical protein